MLLSPPLILSWCKSQIVLPKPPGLPWIRRSRGELSHLSRSAAGRSPGRVCISEEHPETQVPCRTRLRSSDHPAQGGERSLSWYLVALLVIRPSNVVRRESTKACEPKSGRVIMFSLSSSHLLLLDRQARSWRGHAAPSLGGSALPAPISGFPHPSASPAPSQHPSNSLGEVGEGHKPHPPGVYGGELG